MQIQCCQRWSYSHWTHWHPSGRWSSFEDSSGNRWSHLCCHRRLQFLFPILPLRCVRWVFMQQYSIGPRSLSCRLRNLPRKRLLACQEQVINWKMIFHWQLIWNIVSVFLNVHWNRIVHCFLTLEQSNDTLCVPRCSPKIQKVNKYIV